MDIKVISRKDLAAALGISEPMICKHAAKGMPTDSVESAQTWRRRNLDPLRTKKHRLGGNDGGTAKAAADDLEVMRRDPEFSSAIRNDEKLIGQYVFPAFFSSSSTFMAVLRGLLIEKGLSEEDILHVQKNLAMGFVVATNEFFGHSNAWEGGGISFSVPDWLQDYEGAAKHAD